ncbi:MAG: hypothetical protein JRJ29_03340 [Deltaproteobacteria bacterium]|nr:hypothetical protein [Deltaproteobacteria bacterium]
MADPIVADIFRYDPDRDEEPYFQQYHIRVDGKISVLVLLHLIQKEMDQTLSFRDYCCGLQMCRSCLMKINHKKKFACLTLVGPGERVVIEPVAYPEKHVKDLVVETEE